MCCASVDVNMRSASFDFQVMAAKRIQHNETTLALVHESTLAVSLAVSLGEPTDW